MQGLPQQIDIGVDECGRIQSARGLPLPCAVLDQSGTPLPIDIAGYGIERFDLAQDDWQSKFAAWLERDATMLVELDEIAGWHLEQAVRYRRELGLPVDPALRSRGSDHLAEAGRRAVDRQDLRAADTLLTRALALLPLGDDRRPRLALGLARALVPAGQLDRAAPLLGEAEADPRTRPGARITRCEQLLAAEPDEGPRFGMRPRLGGIGGEGGT